jgi:hypothetical protein
MSNAEAYIVLAVLIIANIAVWFFPLRQLWRVYHED